MLFNSYIFLFAFLPLCLVVFAVLEKQNRVSRAHVIVVLSLAFYGYWNAWHVPLILGSILANHLVAKQISRSAMASRKIWLGIGCTFNLGLLGYYKYSAFLINLVADLGSDHPQWASIILPLGISFFTFQQIGFLVDVFRGDKVRYGLSEYASFVLFFPQLIAGPIVHHHDLVPQIQKKSNRWLRPSHLATGVAFFVTGLCKKVIIADSLAPIANSVYDSAHLLSVSSFDAWTATLAYTGQLYFDFSGYCDMAIGLGWMFSIKLPQNFNSPYKATSMIDFWRRWHITLSVFLRDYLYIPLGGSRCGQSRQVTNLFLTMLLAGLWHGAGWTFIIWGAVHGGALVINHQWREFRSRLNTPKLPLVATSCAGWILTFACVLGSWVIFRAHNVSDALALLHAMIPIGRWDIGSMSDLLSIEDLGLCIAAIIACITLPNTHQLLAPFSETSPAASASTPWTRIPWTRAMLWRPTAIHGAMSGLVFVCCICLLTRVNVFLYFQF